MSSNPFQNYLPRYVDKNRCLDHHHDGLTVGMVSTHFHNCTNCNDVFIHTHSIKTYEESIKFPQLCKQCDSQLTRIK